MTNQQCPASIVAAIALAGTSGVFAQGSSPRELEELVVFGTDRSMEARTGSRLNLTIAETPATVDIIDGDAIRARVENSVLEAVTRSAGFTSEANPGNGHSSIAARGFSGQGTVTKLYDGTNYFTAAGTITFPFDTWGIDRVEVLKGPSSVLYGEGGIGGAINIIPRRPQFERSGDVRLMVGEFDTTFVGIDVTGPIADSVAYRLDFSKNQSENWVHYGDSDSEMLALSLRWDVSEDLAISARYDRGDQHPMKYFGTPIANGDFIGDFVESNFNVSDAEIRYEDSAVRVRADWQVSESAFLQAEIFRLATDRFWSNSEFYSFDNGTGLLDRFDPLVIGHDMDHTGVRANLVFQSANNRFKSSLGFEVNDVSFARPTNFGPANPDPLDFDADFDTVDPFNFMPGVLLDLTDAPVLLDNLSDVSHKALFGETQYKFNERLALVGALRLDQYHTDYVRLGQPPIAQSVNALTGRIGFVLDLNESSAVYAQYGTGATHPSNSIVTASASNREADMIESEQFEIGIKQQVADTGLQWSVALFDIVRKDLIEDDPDSGNPSDFIVIPEQTSQGIEVGLSFAASDGFQLHGNLAVLSAATDTGATPNYVPERTWNAGMAWSPIERLRVLADLRYVGERFHPSIPVPSYTVVDASARWDVGDDIAFTLKAENLFDERYASSEYYSTTWLIGKPRTLSFIADYRF